MYTILKPFLFLLPAEPAHKLVSSLLKVPGISSLLGSYYRFEHNSLHRDVFGLSFPNPVGLAAGFDKDAHVFEEMGNLGFGFIEIGTITPRPQPGNDKPRLFRLPADKALINRMGFNNSGAEAALRRLKSRKQGLIVGGNLGKNKTTPNEEAINDYEISFDLLFDHVDYFAVNVSSPNTPGLRELQEREPLNDLLKHLQKLNGQRPRRKPLLLKIAPDLTTAQLDDIVELALENSLDGLIATNTTISRENLNTSDADVEFIGNGGLSGKPVQDRSTEVIRYLADKIAGKIPIIGVGGIMSAEDALEKLDAGATLIQIYTGMIYEGPALIRDIKKAIVNNKLS